MSSNSPSHDMARRLRAGEPLTSAQTAEEYGVTQSLLGTVIRKLKDEEGLEIEGVPIGAKGQKRYRRTLTVPSDPSEWGKGPNVAPSLQAKTRAAKKAAPKSPAPPTPPKPRKRKGLDHPVPALGDTVEVNALTLTEDGEVGISIKGDDGMWLVRIVGYAAPKREVPVP